MFVELLLFGVIVYAFYKWATLNNDYFARRNIKHMKPRFLFGNTGGFYINKYGPEEYASKIYNMFPDEQIFGHFDIRTPQFMVRDPELFKRMTIKDFEHFEDHLAFFNDKLWANSLVFMKGEKWRQMRATLSPAFTGSKMRQMFELVTECTDDLVNSVSKDVKQGKRVNIEMREFSGRYMNDVITTCALGLKTNSIADPDNEFYQNGRKLVDFTSPKALMKFLFTAQFPFIARLFDIQFTDTRASQWFKSTILDTMEMRTKNNIHRPDMINILMQIRSGTLKHQKEENEKNEEGFATVKESDVGKVNVTRTWNDDEIVAQCFIFFAAGFDSSSQLLTMTAYELVVNPNIQQKLFEEIVETEKSLNGQRISYDVLQKMKYLDQVICEVLRKWPPGVMTDRTCTKDYVIKQNNGSSLKIEKGMTLMFPVLALHHDAKYFPEPEKFDPDRFNDENKRNIIPGTYIPFGTGPRNCIGSRFALMQMKAVLFYLLLNFSFEANEKTQIPLKFKKTAFVLEPENGVHLELKPRKK